MAGGLRERDGPLGRSPDSGRHGRQPYYHDERYEPLWSACEELSMPIHTHSGWSPDYGNGPAATAMFVSEVSWYAHRPFTCFLWAGVFERHPNLKLIMTEQASRWIIERLREFEKTSTRIFSSISAPA